MLNIRQDQMFAFSDPLAESWTGRALKLIAAHWPEVYRNTPHDTLRSRLRRTLRDARAAGIDEAADALRYLNVTMLLGVGFAASGQHPWAARILAARIAGPAKTAMLMDAVRSLIERSSHA